MKKIFYAFNFFVFSTINAQPILQDASLLPSTSYSYTVRVNTGFTNPIDMNNDVIWDFTSLNSISPGPIAIIDPSTSTFGSNFPTSNFAYQIANMYSYFEVNSSEMIELSHTMTSIGNMYDFSADGKKILQFPFNYGGTFSDTYISNSISYPVDVAYAGFGTLHLPNGFSYSNVALITETSPLTNVYRWYTTNPFMSVAIYRQVDDVFVWIEQDPGASISEYSSTEMNVFPNPVNDKLTIEMVNEVELNQLEIYSVNGKLIKTVEPNFQNGSMNISTNDLEKGSYVLVVGNNRVKFVK